MTTPHPFDLVYNHRQDPLGLWAEAHARAAGAGTDPIREFERAVAERGFLGHRSGHRVTLYGAAAAARFRAAVLAHFPGAADDPCWSCLDPAGPAVAGLKRELAASAALTKPRN